jgi:hypothetical protein
MKNLFLLFFLSIFSSWVYSQGFNFSKNDISDSKFNINLLDIASKLNNNDSLIFLSVVVFDPLVNNSQYKGEFENWLIPYDFAKFNIDFSVYTNTTPKGINCHFLNSLPDWSDQLKRSSLFIIISESNHSIKTYLDSNKTEFLLEKLDIYSGVSIYRLHFVDNNDVFKWRTNQIIYNLENVPLSEKKEILQAPKKVSFQLGYSSSATVKNKKFNSISSNQIDLLVKGSFGNSNLGVVGGGISITQNKFSTSSNLQFSKAGSFPLDSIYASLSGVSENYIHQSINIAFLIAQKIKSNSKNGFFELSFSPFISILSKLSSTVTGGSIKTYGFKNQINEYLYDIPELGLKTQTDEILNLQNSFKTITYGFNAGFSYNIKLGALILVPNINLKLISIHNKNSDVNAYSISENKFNGVFASYRKNSNFLMPTIGLSISF